MTPVSSNVQELQEDLADAQFAANVRAHHIEKLKAELREAKRMLWAAVRAADGKVEIENKIMVDMPDGVLKTWRDDSKRVVVVQALIERERGRL